MGLHEVYEIGYAKIQRECKESQHSFLKVIAEARKMPVSWLDDLGVFFVPNDRFMLDYFGDEILLYDCYRGNECIWNNALVFPIRGCDGKVAGFGGFYPFDYLDETKERNYYGYSSSSVFKKGRYLYFPRKDLLTAIEDGYLILVDGLFDAVTLSAYGFNAASLMGSSPTQEILMQLRFVKNVVVAADNDEAGILLFDKVKRCLNGVTIFTQTKDKDVDGALKGDFADQVLSDLRSHLEKLGCATPFEVKPKGIKQ